MAQSNIQRLKLLYLAKYFYEETGVDNGKTSSEIIDFLNDLGIDVCDKTIRTDIKSLMEFGFDIDSFRIGNYTYYYLADRGFDFTELRILVDVVQSAKFLSEKTSQELIEKLSTLTDKNSAKVLNSKVQLSNRVKANISKDNAIYYAVQEISDAIENEKKLRFSYSQWVVDTSTRKNIKEVNKHGDKIYRVTPKALIFDDENYYLVAYDQEDNLTKHFRVDKIQNPLTLDESADKIKFNQKLNKSAYSKEVFGMYGGKLVPVELKVSNDIVGVIVDRFSKNIVIWPKEDGTFTTTVKVMLSPQFYAWIFGLGKNIEILYPAEAREGFKNYLKDVNKIYK